MIKKLISSIFKILILSSFGIAQANAQATTAGILPLAQTQFLDQNGNPLTSGKVYFYGPGTTTAKTTWKDINKATPNTNPVNLDAAGRALIWGDGAYRQQVYDRSNNLIWDQTTAITGASTAGGIGDGLAVGTILAWAGLTSPANYQFTYGQALSRATYPDLLTALTISESITCVGGSPTITSIPDTSSLNVGAALEASCVSGGPTILSKTSSTVTLSGNASVSVTTNGTFYPYGNGDGLNTFNVPDFRGVTLVGRCNMGGVDCSNLNATYFSSNASNTPSALNAVGGNQSKTLAAANIPSLTSTNPAQAITVTVVGSQTFPAVAAGGTITTVQVTGAGAGTNFAPVNSITGWGAQNASSGNNAISVVSTGTTDTPFSLISPTKTSNYIIKVTPNTNIGTATISQLQGGLPNKLTGTDVNGIFGNVNLPSGLTLASSNLNFLAQACAGSTWLKSIDTNGTFTCTQPAFSNISGTIVSAQLPLATNAAIGGMKGDGTSITCVAGICTAIGAVAAGIDAGGATTISNGSNGCTLYDNAGAVGCLSNPSAKTTNYTIANTDCGKTIQAGTGATGLLTITLPAVAGFNASCVVTVKNGNSGTTGRGQILSGFPTNASNILWPTQSIIVQIVNGSWVTISNPGRWLIPTSRELCVRQDGVAVNTDGLGDGTVAADCYSTIAQAVVVIGEQWDGAGYNSCSLGLYAGGTSILNEGAGDGQTGQSVGCYLTYNVRGAITWTATGPCLNAGDNSVSVVNWNLGFIPTFKCNTSNSPNKGQFYCHQTCIFDFNGGTAIWIPGGSNDNFFYVDLQGSASFNAQVNIGDGINTYTPLSFMYCEAHCSKITASGTVAFSAHVTMGVAFVLRAGALILSNLTWPGASITNPSTPTGNSVLITNGTTIPGGTASGSGGQVCTSVC